MGALLPAQPSGRSPFQPLPLAPPLWPPATRRPAPRRTLLTTEECLLHPNRNPGMSKGEVEAALKRFTGVDKVIWLPK